MRMFKSQLVDRTSDRAVTVSGGKVLVTLAGSPKKAALQNKKGQVIANPVDLVNGSLEFYTDDAVTNVDMFIQAPTGHCIVARNVPSSANHAIYFDRKDVQTTLIIPFHIQDTAANVETKTGFVHPAQGTVEVGPTIEISTVDAGQTIDVGTDSANSGDADGYIDGVSTAALGVVKPTITFGSVTLGAKLQAFAGTGSTIPVPEQNTSEKGREITYTLNAGTDTAAGYIKIPMQLPVSSI